MIIAVNRGEGLARVGAVEAVVGTSSIPSGAQAQQHVPMLFAVALHRLQHASRELFGLIELVKNVRKRDISRKTRHVAFSHDFSVRRVEMARHRQPGENDHHG